MYTFLHIALDFDQIFKSYKSEKNDKFKDIEIKDRFVLNWPNMLQK